jgi:hypothetical protein
MGHAYANHGFGLSLPNACEKAPQFHAGVDDYGDCSYLEEGEADQEKIQAGAYHDEDPRCPLYAGIQEDSSASVGIRVQLCESKALVPDGAIEPSSLGNAGSDVFWVAFRDPRKKAGDVGRLGFPPFGHIVVR